MRENQLHLADTPARAVVPSAHVTIEPVVSVEQLLHALQRNNIPLPYEIGTFIALECCERVLESHTLVTATDVFVSDEGDVTLAPAPRADGEEEACRALVEMLGDLLVRSAPGVPAMLLTLVEEGPSDGAWGLKRLRDDLEASLVPLNRSATRRVISRLLREVRRERGGLGGTEPAQQSKMNRELDIMLGGRPDLAADTVPGMLDAPQVATAPDGTPAADTDVRDDRADSDTPTGVHVTTQVEDATGPTSRAAPRLSPADAAGAAVRDLDAIQEAGGGRVGLTIGIALVLLSALMVGAYVQLGRDGVRRLLGMELAPAAANEAAEVAAPAPAPVVPAPVHGTLDVTSTPARAQTLLYVGQAPVEIARLPVGVAHELVAVAEGQGPGRAVVPANATWSETGGELTYELAIPTTEGGNPDVLGPTTLPQDLGSPSGALGTVRVTSTPPGARIYQLVGFTPDVHVENLRLDRDAELLVYLKDHAPERVTVGRDQFAEEGGTRRAKIDVELRAK